MLRNLLLLVFSTLLSVGLLELALRAIGPGDEVAYVPDTQLIFRPGPSRSLRYVRFPEHGGEVIATRFDAHGFRDGGGDPNDRDAPRVFVYGDSFIQASYSSVQESFAGQLRARLADRATSPVRVVNAGVDGYGPDQVYLRMREEVPRFRPDLVVLSVFADNDVGDLIRNKLFRLDDAGALVRHAFVVGDELAQHYRERQRLNDLPALARALVDPQLLRRDLRILLERRMGLQAGWLADVPIDTAYRTATDLDWIGVWRKRGLDEFEEYVGRADPVLRLDNIRSDHYDADVTIEPQRESSRYKLALADAVLGEAIEFLRAQRVPLLVLIVPSPIDACLGYDWQVDAQAYPHYERRTLTDAVARTASRLQAPAVNLFESFSGAHCNDLYYHHGNNHWNEHGQALAARLVAERIRSAGLLR